MANLHQLSLLQQSEIAEIHLRKNHELVQITSYIDWDKLQLLAMNCREAKVKKSTGPAPRYRELLGAVVLMSLKKIDYRQCEDMIAHYAPARYLCNLMDSTWQPDHVTVFDFTKMLGPSGMELINQEVLSIAQDQGFLDPSQLMSDTTAQEAKIPYPTEVGLMSDFMSKVSKHLKKTGKTFTKVKAKIKESVKKVKGLARTYYLFCKDKESKSKAGKKIFHTVSDIQKELGDVFSDLIPRGGKPTKELKKLWEVMETLLPQIKKFLYTGFVANKKIIHLAMPELYSIVRGKAGKRVEFGLKWGISRIGGGFVSGFLHSQGEHTSDIKFCEEAVKEHIKMFGEAPEVYGFDRGGYSKGNIKRISKLGVKDVGIAPKGKAKWEISETKQKLVKSERAQVEGSIGTIKSQSYGFNKPNARSTSAMESCGHRSILGFNLRKIFRENQKAMLQAT